MNAAFDVVMQDPIPNKGAVLTRLSAFWFEKLRAQGMPLREAIVEARR